MPPQVVLIRHAQGLHNNYSFQDPELTSFGKQQCADLQKSLFERYGDLKPEDVAVVVSPMQRTLQTATLGLNWLVDAGVVFEASADWQENSDDQCDIGSPTSRYQAAYHHIDFTKVDPVWTEKTSPAGAKYAHTRTAVLARANRALEDLYSRPQKVVFAVSHGAFLRVALTRRWFANADYRVFEFGENLDDLGRRDLIMEEGMESGALGISWTRRIAEIGEDLPEA